MAQKNESTSCTHDELGYYDCPVDATDTATLGRLKLACVMAGAVPVWHNYMVVRADVYDTMCSTDYLQVDVIQIASADAETTLENTVWDTDVTSHTTDDTAGENLNVINDMLTGKKAISGTTMTHYKQDGITARKVFTLDSATNATSRTPV